MKSIWDNLLVRFSVVSFVALVTVAASIALFISGRMKTDAIDGMIGHATFDLQAVSLGTLTAADFEGPMVGERLEKFDDFVRSNLLVHRTAMVKLWSKDGSLVYSSDTEDIEVQDGGAAFKLP